MERYPDKQKVVSYMPDSIALKATVEYCTEHRRPAGKNDSGGRWYPDEIEKASCCSGIRSPSRSYPWSFYKHCHSRKHVRQLIIESPSEEQRIAIAMTVEDAPLRVNGTGLLLHVAKKLLGHA